MNLLIANPSYANGYVGGSAQAAALRKHPDWEVHFYESSMSLLTFNFNSAWADALNLRDIRGLSHFLLMHADIRPRSDEWLDIMLEEMEKFSADILSVIIPIKSQDGWTSTAIDTDLWRPRRITLTEAFESAPPTWTHEKLLFNTGLMLVDFRKPWVEQVCFTVNDRIHKNAKGKWEAEVESEDWNFSRQCRELKVAAYVTRRVTVDHYGTGAYPNYLVWGERFDGEWQRKQSYNGLVQSQIEVSREND